MSPFNQQLEQQLPNLRRYARSLLANPMLADDLVQDTLEKAILYQQQWTPGSNLRAWLFTIAHNLYANQIRAFSRYQEVDDTEMERIQAPPVDPDNRSEKIRQLLDRLPFQQREVLALVALEGFSYQQVAEVIGAPIGTVMSRLSRARENMRKALAAGGPNLRRVK